MITIRNLSDCPLITDPYLWREVHGFMSVCLYEDEEADLEFLIAEETDIPQLQILDDPEEWSRMEIHCCGETRTLYRIVYVTGVIFLDERFAHAVPFLPENV